MSSSSVLSRSLFSKHIRMLALQRDSSMVSNSPILHEIEKNLPSIKKSTSFYDHLLAKRRKIIVSRLLPMGHLHFEIVLDIRDLTIIPRRDHLYRVVCEVQTSHNSAPAYHQRLTHEFMEVNHFSHKTTQPVSSRGSPSCFSVATPPLTLDSLLETSLVFKGGFAVRDGIEGELQSLRFRLWDLTPDKETLFAEFFPSLPH